MGDGSGAVQRYETLIGFLPFAYAAEERELAHGPAIDSHHRR
jgi:hypothetical protein